MSTKCYYGIRFPLAKLPEFVRFTRPAFMLAVEEHAKKFAGSINPKSEGYKDEARKHNKNRKSVIKHRKNCWACKVRIVMKMFQEAAANYDRNPWCDVGCGVNLWFPKRSRFVLGHPWGESITDIKFPEWVEEYGYWNNTDKPDSISSSEWTRRKKAWDSVLECNSLEKKLQLVGFDATQKYTVDFSWLELRLLRSVSPSDNDWGNPHGW